MDTVKRYLLLSSFRYAPFNKELTTRKWWWVLVLSVICVVCGAIAIISDNYYNHNFRWYNTDLPSLEEIATWDEEKRHNTLFRLSRWESFKSGDQFRQMVQMQIKPLGLNATERFHFLELGVGVGAFSRIILQQFPLSSGVGIDIVPAAIEISKIVLPAHRMTTLVGDMKKIDSKGSTFHVVFVPGALCLLFSMDQVRLAVAEIHRVLKPGGGLCISLMPSATSETGSCTVRIPKSFWFEEVAYLYGSKILTIEDMDNWNLPHSMGRYHMCLRKPAY